jgi:hypothetical protein
VDVILASDQIVSEYTFRDLSIWPVLFLLIPLHRVKRLYSPFSTSLGLRKVWCRTDDSICIYGVKWKML